MLTVRAYRDGGLVEEGPFDAASVAHARDVATRVWVDAVDPTLEELTALVEDTRPVSELKVSDYDAIVVAGGFGVLALGTGGAGSPYLSFLAFLPIVVGIAVPDEPVRAARQAVAVDLVAVAQAGLGDPLAATWPRCSRTMRSASGYGSGFSSTSQ